MKKAHFLVTGCILVILPMTATGGKEGPQYVPRTDSIALPSSSLKIDSDFGRMPLYFIPNKGQMDDRVAYYVQGKDKTLYFTSEGITFALAGTPEQRENHSPLDRKTHKPWVTEEFAGKDSDAIERWVVKLDFIGANPHVEPIGQDETGAIFSYFKGSPGQWHAGLPTYSKIIYPNVWPGIDLVYYGTVNKLKYEFIVRPGADPSKIRLAYRGAKNISVDDDGRLQVNTPVGAFSDDVPAAYQMKDGKRAEIRMKYRMMGKTSSCLYGFEVEDFDHSLPLVLDPAVLVYCGYIGGSHQDEGVGIAVDASGSVYVTGSAQSTQATFPVTVGPDLTFNDATGLYDAFVAKVNPAGTALVYCGYIGGSNSDFGSGIAVDSAGNAYIAGSTYSSETTFPVTVGPDLTYNGVISSANYDAFVAKVDSSGTALLYCGYIGGTSNDAGKGIAVDGSGNAYVAGHTRSREDTFPVTVGPDLTFNGGYDGFVAKVNSSGTGLIYCGYIGGSSGNSDDCWGIAVDGSGYAYVTGAAYSSEASFPVTVGPDLTHNGDFDAYVAKVDSSGNGLLYCGYIGGSDEDFGNGIAVDSAGNAYVAGYTSSTEATFPVTVGPDLAYNAGTHDAFVAKVDSSGSMLSYCGYIGGSNSDFGRGIAVDSAGNAYIVGSAYSTEATFPVTVGPDLTHNSVEDVFVAKVNCSGTALIYCGYIGGSSYDFGNGIAVDSAGNAHVAGETISNESTFPVTVGPDLTWNGMSEAFVAKISYWDLWALKHAVGDFDGDGTDEVAVDFGATGIYLYDGGAWTQLNASDPESLVAADVDGDNMDELLADLGGSGLWLWNAGAWSQLSGVNIEGMAAGDVDADAADEVAGDFGTVGMWLYNGGAWSQLSGVNADYIDCADLDGIGGIEIVGDFGATGLWIWNSGAWTQLSGVNADYVAFGNTNGLAGEQLIGDFGATGLWLWDSGAWTQLSGVNADYMITGDVDNNGDDELFGDFAATGLWLWDSGAWTQLSGVNADFMIRADADGNGDDEILVDFGVIGLWQVNGSSWTQLSGVNAEYMMAGDFDGDNADEIMADFGSLGMWLWDGGAWSQISANDPD